MNLIKWTMSILLLESIFLGLVSANAQEEMKDKNFIEIDEMKSLDEWDISGNSINHSIDISLVDDGIKISYDLKEKGSWVDIYKKVDFAKIIGSSQIPGIDKLLFYYEGKGDPNTLELKLAYDDVPNSDDDTFFSYRRSGATSTDGNTSNFYLDPWDITYLWGGISPPKDREVDFSKVKQVRFTISNDPYRNDVLGKGYVIIKGIKAEPIPPQIQIFIEQNKEIIVALIAFLGVIVGRKSK